MDDYVLSMKNISKEYDGNPVLKNVSLNVKKGEIHALLGENGAGKSTLMNILFGMPVIHTTGGFKGEVLLDGASINITTPRHAMELGIGMVHQEFMLIPGFTITENIKISREISKPDIVSRIFGKYLEKLDRITMAKDAKKVLDKVGLTIEEYVKVAGLPVGYMQFVEIARELDKSGIRLLVFDEPTAVLAESEATRLLEAMKMIAESGIAVIFITHRLDEVIEVADNITVLRDGELVATREKAKTDIVELASLMIGREVERLAQGDDTRQKSGNIALSLKNFSVDMPGEVVSELDLDVYEGEILGIGGLAGQGKVGIPNGIMNMYEASGDVTIFGEPFALNKLGNALKYGVATVSEDRKGVGLLLDMPIEDNIAFGAMQTANKFFKNMGIMQRDGGAIRRHANSMIEELDIRCVSGKQAVGSLSGGNQQKVCLARAITMNPKILIVAEPTRGIDIGAKEIVMKKLLELNRNAGITVIMVSSELAELRSVCDRIAIVSKGKIAEILPPDADDSDFGLAMSGLKAV